MGSYPKSWCGNGVAEQGSLLDQGCQGWQADGEIIAE
jgi:hypothetical protein